jgi:hypothetical protein
VHVRLRRDRGSDEVVARGIGVQPVAGLLSGSQHLGAPGHVIAGTTVRSRFESVSTRLATDHAVERHEWIEPERLADWTRARAGKVRTGPGDDRVLDERGRPDSRIHVKLGRGNDPMTVLDHDRLDGGNGFDAGTGGFQDGRIEWVASVERFDDCESPY